MRPNTSGLNYLLMGGARGTDSLTWRQNEDGAEKIKAKVGTTHQNMLRAGAAFFGAPVDAETGQASARAGPLYSLTDGMEGCAGKPWTQIEAEGVKSHKKGTTTENTTMVANAY